MPAPSPALTELSNAIADAAEAAAASTVLVDGRRRMPASGVAWTDDLVITAHHVIERDPPIGVVLPDGTRRDAALVGRDPGTDLALLRVEGGGLQPAARETAPARVAQLVIAVGRPREGTHEASVGSISRLSGPWRTHLGSTVSGYLVPEVTFLPGFSGGPLVSAAGKVIGINTSGLARSGGITIPAADIQEVVDALLSSGRVRRGYLGIATQPTVLPSALKEAAGGQESGLLVTSVAPDSPADKGGLGLGDVLLSFGDVATTAHEQLQVALGAASIGRETPTAILRGGARTELTITPGERGAA